jgi:hypothetical protein
MKRCVGPQLRRWGPTNSHLVTQTWVSQCPKILGGREIPGPLIPSGDANVQGRKCENSPRNPR